MRIRSVEAVGLRGATPPGGWSIELQPDDVVHTLIFVRTGDGPSGVGSVSSSLALVRAALELLEPFLLGEDAREPERVSETLRQRTFWLGRGGAVTHTISGIDIALWDIAGQLAGQPVGRLLGGRYRDRVRPYASVLMQDPDRMTEELAELRKVGFRAFKIGWGPFGRQDAATDELMVSTARNALGPDVLLAVDAGASDTFWKRDLQWAQRTARMLADYDIAWFEEALRADRIGDYAHLRAHSRTPIAGGEVLTMRQTFDPYLDAGSFDIIQPDVTKVGGLSEARRIGWAAEARGIRLIPHGWNTAVGLAADLHLATALVDTDLVEYRTGAAYIDELPVRRWQLDADGMLPVPDQPGLGVDIDVEALERFAVR